MLFQIEKNYAESWSLTPLSGPFEGRVIATADGVSLKDVKFEGRSIVGGIQAIWGLNVLIDDVYDSAGTVAALHINSIFPGIKDAERNRVSQEYDSFKNAADKTVKAAARLMVMGSNIFGKGMKW